MADVFRWLDESSTAAMPYELQVETHGDGLRVSIWDDQMEGTVIDLDHHGALDLVDQLESWRAGWFAEEADRG